MDSTTNNCRESQQLIQLFAASIAQTNAQLQSIRAYAEDKRCDAEMKRQDFERVSMEAQQLRSEVQQLRSIIYYVEREKNNELSRSALLQQLIDTQRRIIRDYDRGARTQLGPDALPSLIHYEPPLQEGYCHGGVVEHHEIDKSVALSSTEGKGL